MRIELFLIVGLAAAAIALAPSSRNRLGWFPTGALLLLSAITGMLFFVAQR